VPDPDCLPPDLEPGRRPRSRPGCPPRPPWSPPAARSRKPGVEHHVYATSCLTTASGRSTCRFAALCGESGGDSRHRSDFVRVRARHGPRPGRIRPRTRRFPTPRRVRPRRVPSHSRANHGRMYPSGHDEPLRRRRRRVTRKGRSASGGPAQQVDSVTAVAFPACPRRCKIARFSSRAKSHFGSRRRFRSKIHRASKSSTASRHPPKKLVKSIG